MTTNREMSKKDWKGLETFDSINCGSLQRIADATEKMAQNYTRMQNDLDYYRKVAEDYRKRLAKETRRVNALRGVITRMKKRQ